MKSEVINGVISGLISGVVSGLIVLGVQRFLDKRDSHQKKNFLTNDTIDLLMPERNFNKAKELLGEANKVYTEFIENKDNQRIDICCHLYVLSNAKIKITTLDKENIYSITVLSDDKNIKIPFLDIWTKEDDLNNFGTSKINKQMIDEFQGNYIGSRVDSVFEISRHMTNPYYKCIYYYCYAAIEDTIENLENRKIIGFCVSEEQGFYIHDYELR